MSSQSAPTHSPRLLWPRLTQPTHGRDGQSDCHEPSWQANRLKVNTFQCPPVILCVCLASDKGQMEHDISSSPTTPEKVFHGVLQANSRDQFPCPKDPGQFSASQYDTTKPPSSWWANSNVSK